jgi:hypothetical protein
VEQDVVDRIDQVLLGQDHFMVLTLEQPSHTPSLGQVTPVAGILVAGRKRGQSSTHLPADQRRYRTAVNASTQEQSDRHVCHEPPLD